MKKMSPMVAGSISSAVFCGLWTYIAGVTGLSIWAGFAGCTTYFACGKRGLAGIKKSVINNFAGVACGMAILVLGNIFPVLGHYGIWSALLTLVMCNIPKYELFNSSTGIFIGCFTSFASGGDWKMLCLCLVIGAFLGLICDYGGEWLHKTVTK